MDPFLQAITSFPTVPLTVLLGVVVGYWIFALVTGAAFDGGDAMAGGVKAVGDATSGAIKGAGEAVAGALKGTVEAVAGDHDADLGDVAEAGLLGTLGLGKVPITISLSVIALVAWTVSTLTTLILEPANILFQSALLLISLVGGLLGAAVLLRPLGKALDQSKPARRRDSLGQICTITSGRVDGSFGTAQVDDGAAGLNVHVICPKTNTLKKGDRAILVDFDSSKDTYEIEPVDWLMPQEIEALNDPARAAQIISGRVRRR
ncbi:MAG: hypothetical protein Q8K32_14690 [Archangium sp.]|nr:hypothetical protein [Archangium sp.]